MSTRTLLVLFVVLVVVAGMAFLLGRQEEVPEPSPTPLPQPERTQLLEGVDIERVTRLEVRDATEEHFVSFLREPDGVWQQTYPTATLTISQTMFSDVTALLNLTSRRTLPADENPLSAYGLEEPSYTIVLAVRRDEGDTARHTFMIGNRTPAGDDYYIQKAGDPRVYIVASFSIDNLIRLLTEPPIAPPIPVVSGALPIMP